MTKTDKNEPERLTLHVSQLIAGALAAVTAAALSARLGVTGTLVGTAAVSIISGIASTLYEHSVRRTRRAVELARTRLAERPFPGFQHEGTDEPDRPSWWRRIPRRNLAYAGAGALATFVLAVGIITAIELAYGKPLSGSGNGTTVSRAFEGTSNHNPAPTPSPQPTKPTQSPSAPSSPASPTPSHSPSPAHSPKSKPSSSHSPSATTPSQSPTQQPTPPSQAPSNAPSDVPTPPAPTGAPSAGTH